MTAFDRAYTNLNDAQRQAVDRIDGPVLVIAGPGTGKTQLLSARVANILRLTDTLPQNILCLTFTESGAANMRERLSRFIGQAAYDVNIGTYHAFGGDLIQRFPEYFAETRLQSPIDDLGKRQIVGGIVEAMSYANPLKSTQYHLHDLIGTLSEVKRGLLDEVALRAIATENTAFIIAASGQAATVFEGLAKMPGSYAKAAPYFEQLLTAIRPLVPATPVHAGFGSLAALAVGGLQQALGEAEASNSSKPLTAWKNDWLAKDAANRFIFNGERENRRIEALADVFVHYQAALAARGLYDFDDMILRSIQALEQHDDLRYSLQEQYLYLLLDEFQDTNAAQLKLVRLLTDNPLSEGRPNVMAVGDDDQAIYAFQGAMYSNMIDFHDMYREPLVVNLTDNYRSHADILYVAHGVAGQIGSRLTGRFEMDKDLKASNASLPTDADIDRHEFVSDVGQYDWISSQIETLVKGGVAPSEIAVLAPKHKQLEPLVPFLNEREIAVRYEKRDNILETPAVHQLVTMSKLVLAIAANDADTADTLWPEVLSYDFWQLPTADIWRLAWQVRDSRPRPEWSRALLDEPSFRPACLLFLNLAARVGSEHLETILDYLIGNEGVETRDPETPLVTSPLKTYYCSAEARAAEPDRFYELLSHLTVLRARLRDHQAANEDSLTLRSLIDFIGLYEAAEERMINVSPYNQRADAVQLMTVFKAKGLEFQHVFLPSCHDDVWGDSSRGNANRLTLPPNLAPIRHAGATADERLRILFVAVTRARHGLHLTSFKQTFAGKSTKRLKYLDEQEQPDGSFVSQILPAGNGTIQHDEAERPALESLQLNWHGRHVQGLADQQLRDLLQERLEQYRLSPTQLNVFTDMVHGGPESFFLSNMLRFPQASGPAGLFGTAVHETLQWLQLQIDRAEKPTVAATQEYFADCMRRMKLPAGETERLVERGRACLAAYIPARLSSFVPGNKAEFDFWPENVILDNGARLSGKVDRMDLDAKNRTITVIDYKTGSSFDRWGSDLKLHKYKHQLYFYKLLIENSRTYRGWHVDHGRLEFVEPADDGTIHTLELDFVDKELDTTRRLIQAVWQNIMAMHLPDTSAYDTSLKGVRDFETDLLAGL